MKQEINKIGFFAIIGVVLVLAGWFVWYYSESSYNRPGDEERRYRNMERWAAQNNYDMRKHPLTAPFYYKYNPSEKKPPPGQQPEGKPIYER